MSELADEEYDKFLLHAERHRLQHFEEALVVKFINLITSAPNYFYEINQPNNMALPTWFVGFIVAYEF